MKDWSTYTDEELVEIFCRKDSQIQKEMAFNEIVSRYHSRLMSRVYSKTHRLDDSEEVLQEFWKDFARTVEKNYNPQQGRLKSWIYGVLHHKIVDFFRRNRHSQSPLLPGEEGEVWPTEWPGDILQAMENCLRSLPPKYGKILCLLFLPGGDRLKEEWPELGEQKLPVQRILGNRPLEDITESLGRPLADFIELVETFTGEKLLMATAKTWKHRAVQLLQECLNRQGFSPP